MNDTLFDLPLAQVHPDPNNPRKEFDPGELQELADSIREIGLEQPVTVRPDGDRFILIAGERRYRAHQLLGAATIQAIIRDISAEEAGLRQVVENLQRADLNPMDEARGFKSAMERFQLNQSELAAKLGIQRIRVNKALNLLKTAPAVQAAIGNGHIKPGHAEVLVTMNHQEQAAAVERIRAGKLSVADTRKEFQQAENRTPARCSTSNTFTARPAHPAAHVLLKATSRLLDEADQLSTADLEAIQQAVNALQQAVT
jgi:ParB family transcriptional regulator, chromosome partitioning protein